MALKNGEKSMEKSKKKKCEIITTTAAMGENGRAYLVIDENGTQLFKSKAFEEENYSADSIALLKCKNWIQQNFKNQTEGVSY